MLVDVQTGSEDPPLMKRQRWRQQEIHYGGWNGAGKVKMFSYFTFSKQYFHNSIGETDSICNCSFVQQQSHKSTMCTEPNYVPGWHQSETHSFVLDLVLSEAKPSEIRLKGITREKREQGRARWERGQRGHMRPV